MRLKTKLYLGFSSILLLMILSFGFVINTANQMYQGLNEIVEERYEMVRLANIVQNETNNTARMLRDGILDRSHTITQEEANEIRKSRIKATQAIDKLDTLISSQEVREIVTGLKVVNKSYNNAAEEVISLVKVSKWDEATTVLIDDYKEVRLQLLELSADLKLTQEKAMENILQQSTVTYQQNVTTLIAFMAVIFSIGAAVILWLLNTITTSINRVTKVISSVDYEKSEQIPRIEVMTKDEIGDIAIAFNEMAHSLEENALKQRELSQKMQEQSWLDNKIATLAVTAQGVQEIKIYAQLLLSEIVNMVDATYGVFYIKKEEEKKDLLKKIGSYAATSESIGADSFVLGEGLVGQCALENKVIYITDLPQDHVKIASGLGNSSPKSLMLLPIQFEGQVIGVLELASFKCFSPLQEKLLRKALANIGVTLNTIIGRMEVEKLLKETQALNEALKIRSEELQVRSEELKIRQEELRSINEELEKQYKNSEQKTKELESTKAALEEKANQLLLASKYKSEFLANMSHELRTPLNSLLILTQLLSENKDQNLTKKQVEYANTIYSSGRNLLTLINDILDLSKIEAGKMEVISREVAIVEIKDVLDRQFRPVAQSKNLHFTIEIADNLPRTIFTDENRLQQIVANLLSNAFKFTQKGEVKLSITKNQNSLTFSVSDTGIGIPKEKQKAIFEAFQQADGTINRRYGGTGLGLSISRVLAQLLGGHITVQSEEGKGSSFTLVLPLENPSVTHKDSEPFAATPQPTAYPQHLRDIEQIENPFKNKKILIVDDDMRNIYALTAALEEHQMQVFFAENGAKGIDLLERLQQVDLVLMDIMMPEMDGYQAMKLIRENSKFKELPIVALTAKAMKNDREKCIAAGASDYISKPVQMDQLLYILKIWL